MNNDWVIAIVFFIIGLIPAYYFYKKGIRIKEPVYSIKSNNLISGSASTLQNLSISYKRRKIENITVSKILFYNRGAETIHRQDIATINPLKISSETCTILDASVLQVNNPANVFKVILEKGSEYVLIDFDYLDNNQGAVIQVVHTGLSSENIGLYGDIKGVEKLIGVPPDRLSTGIHWTELTKRPRTIVTMMVALSYAVIGAFFLYKINIDPIYSRYFAETPSILVIFIFPFVTILLFFVRFARNVLKGLEMFNE